MTSGKWKIPNRIAIANSKYLFLDSFFLTHQAVPAPGGRAMQFARVLGTVVATVKSESLEGRKLLVIQPLDSSLNQKGQPMVAIDSVGAGKGEIVFWCRGREASFPFLPSEVPSDCTIVGIVDSVFLDSTFNAS
jgi:microcompartment protein CcmK/EutM